eukprot:CAMPEP_0179342786 /NCGR_PEP_ID=MMETSP0797-20121207/70606_1 /TAXON_ID=47934 /ORGANISM="Dinophysis acuminata, Strain DAEP01" /LENGTH=49 /DNA_ID= /DNA_START= /DNA_END= /DNA_ORIENTATION=
MILSKLEDDLAWASSCASGGGSLPRSRNSCCSSSLSRASSRQVKSWAGA